MLDLREANLMKQTLTIKTNSSADDTIVEQIKSIVHNHEPEVEVKEEKNSQIEKTYSAEPRPRGCSGLGEPRPALPSF